MYLSTLFEWEEQSKRIDINHLIILCKIGEEYKSFCEDLENLIKSKKNNDLIQDAYRVMKGENCLKRNKFKEFVKKYENVIRIMKEYNCLYDLTVLNYDQKGNYKKNPSEDFFYQYIQKHQEDIEKIESVVLKLYNLGFDKIYLGENINFSNFQYKLSFVIDGSIDFLENIKIIPTYIRGDIKYTTSDSNYCMNLNRTGYGENETISKYNKQIFLNNLIFDSDKLPDELTKESIIDSIINLAKDKKEEYINIRNSIDLNININDIKEQYESLEKITSTIDEVQDNEELKNLINQMKNIINELQSFSKTYEDNVIDSNPDITEEIMKIEKKLYLDRRTLSGIDIHF